MDYAEISTIRGQYQAGMWPQFLQMVQIKGLRGWTGQAVEFNFPVVAVVGENGSGKSTLMKVAACAYDNIVKDKRFYPSVFFVGTHWDTIRGVEIDYRVKRGPNVGLSEFLCARHTMTARSQYAETEEAGAAGKHP
jgi:predicted ATPase